MPSVSRFLSDNWLCCYECKRCSDHYNDRFQHSEKFLSRGTMDEADDERAVFDNAHVEHREGRTEHSAKHSHNDRRQKHDYVHRQHAAHLQPASLTNLTPICHQLNIWSME